MAKTIESMRSSLGSAAQECQTLQEDENNTRHKFSMTYQELVKYRAYLQQNANVVNGSVKDSNEQIAHCKRLVESLQAQLTSLYQELMQKRHALLLKLRESVDKISTAQQEYASVSLRDWKKKQTEAQVGAPFDETQIDKIQEIFELLAEVTWTVRQYALLLQQNLALPVQEPCRQQMETNVNVLINNLNQLLGFLVTESFIVSKQPPPVVKKKTNFYTEARLLIGDKLGVRLNLNETTVSIYIISEEQARQLKRNSVPVEEITKSPSGLILPLPLKKTKKGGTELFGPTVNFQFDEQRILVARFKEIKLESISDEDRKSTRPFCKKNKPGEPEPITVTLRKYCFLFTSQFKVQDLILKVWTLSLPVGVTVHGSQDCASHATIFWDHSFALQDRQPFQIRDSVPWPEFERALKWKFRSLVGCEKDLSPSDLHYIAEKIFEKNLTDYSGEIEDMSPGVHFSFWKWFFTTVAVVKHLKDLWDEGYIVGFVSKQRVAELLRSAGETCFLVRFSDSQCGGVSISFVPSDCFDQGEFNRSGTLYEPLHLAPFTCQDLQQMSLPDRINCCPQLQPIRRIYPDKDKDELLRRWCQSSTLADQVTKSGYTKPQMIMWIPSASTGQLQGSESPAVMSYGMSSSASPSDEYYSMTAEIDDITIDDLSFPDLGLDFFQLPPYTSGSLGTFRESSGTLMGDSSGTLMFPNGTLTDRLTGVVGMDSGMHITTDSGQNFL